MRTLARNELKHEKNILKVPHKISNKCFCINPLSANLTKWSNILKQFVSYC